MIEPRSTISAIPTVGKNTEFQSIDMVALRLLAAFPITGLAVVDTLRAASASWT
jgi:hypothetical protein